MFLIFHPIQSLLTCILDRVDDKCTHNHCVRSTIPTRVKGGSDYLGRQVRWLKTVIGYPSFQAAEKKIYLERKMH